MVATPLLFTFAAEPITVPAALNVTVPELTGLHPVDVQVTVAVRVTGEPYVAVVGWVSVVKVLQLEVQFETRMKFLGWCFPRITREKHVVQVVPRFNVGMTVVPEVGQLGSAPVPVELEVE